MSKLILFDIDGTLLRVQSNRMKHIVLKALNINGAIPPVQMKSFAGRTDSDIFKSLLAENYNDDVYKTLRDSYIKTISEELSINDVKCCVGVQSLLEQLQNREHHYGLLTGNYKESAFVKLRCAGLDHFFDGDGAFGDVHENRNHLPQIALELYKQTKIPTLRSEDIFIIGDTPKDIECAKYIGAKSIAVATGAFTYDELKAHTPDLLLHTLDIESNNWIDEFIN